MAVKIKWGSDWVGPSSGGIRVKWGSSWITPATMRVKWGSGWVNTGYIGLPNVPRNLRVMSWTYDRLRVEWTAPAGGAAPASYEMQLRGPKGGLIESATGTGLSSPNWVIDEMTKYMVRVRSVGSTGAVSDWTPDLQVQIGRPEITSTKMVAKTRDWADSIRVDMYRDEINGNKIPANVRVTHMVVDLDTQTFDTSLMDFNHRELHLVRDGVDIGQGSAVGINDIKPCPWKLRFPFAQNTPGVHGLVTRGIGWSTRGVTSGWRVVGTIRSEGIETYQQEVTVVTQTEVRNSYW